MRRRGLCLPTSARAESTTPSTSPALTGTTSPSPRRMPGEGPSRYSGNDAARRFGGSFRLFEPGHALARPAQLAVGLAITVVEVAEHRLPLSGVQRSSALTAGQVFINRSAADFVGSERIPD